MMGDQRGQLHHQDRPPPAAEMERDNRLSNQHVIRQPVVNTACEKAYTETMWKSSIDNFLQCGLIYKNHTNNFAVTERMLQKIHGGNLLSAERVTLYDCTNSLCGRRLYNCRSPIVVGSSQHAPIPLPVVEMEEPASAMPVNGSSSSSLALQIPTVVETLSEEDECIPEELRRNAPVSEAVTSLSEATALDEGISAESDQSVDVIWFKKDTSPDSAYEGSSRTSLSNDKVFVNLKIGGQPEALWMAKVDRNQSLASVQSQVVKQADKLMAGQRYKLKEEEEEVASSLDECVGRHRNYIIQPVGPRF